MQETKSPFIFAVCEDQNMVTRLCPYCQSNSDMAPAWASSEAVGEVFGVTQYRVRLACVCANCHELSTAVIASTSRHVHTSSGNQAMRDALRAQEVEWSPLAAPSPEYPHVPAHVARCAKEAHMAHSIKADAASILMTRTTIEATAKDKGVIEGQLYRKIETMKERELVRPAVVTIAHAIRVLGNDMAHGDVEELPTAEDATDALRLMDMILEEVYQAAATAAEILARREARTS